MANQKWMKSINIAIGVDTTTLDKGLKDAKSLLRETTQEATELQKALKWDASPDALIRAQEAAQAAVKASIDQVELLKDAIKQTSEEGGADAQKHIKLLKTQLVAAQNEAKKAADRLNSVMGAEFRRNLSDANSSLELTNRKVTALKASLEIKWDEGTFIKAQAEARSAIEQTNAKAELLRKEIIRLESETTTDKSKSEFDALSAELEETKNKAKQAQQELNQINQLKFDRLTDQLNGAGDALLRGGTVMTAGITLPLAYVGKQALETASQLSEVQNVVDQSFKSGAEAIDGWSKSLLESHGLSELTAKQYSGLFKSMSNGMQIANKAGTEMARTLTEMIPDVASYYNLSLDAVGNKLKSIYTGETESLKEIGVIMTEANLNAHALANGMEQLSDDMSQQEKVALRYSFVMDALKDAQGDFARTLDTSLANQTRLAQEQFKTLAATLANELLPIATDVLKWANDLMKGFAQMDEDTKRTTLVILGLAAGIGPVITATGGLIKIIAGAGAAYKNISASIAMFTTANTAAAASQGAVNAVMLASPAALVVAGIVAVVGAVTLYNNTLEDAAKMTEHLNKQLDETVKTYEQVASSAEKSVSQFEGEALVTDNLIKRYDELNNKTGITAAEKEELSNIVSKLNELLGTSIVLSGQEATIYDATTASLQKLVQARREEIGLISLKNKAVAAGEALIDVEKQKDDAEKNVQYWKEQKESTTLYNPYIFNKSLGIDKYEEALKLYNDILIKEKEYQQQIDEYANQKPYVPESSSGDLKPAVDESAAKNHKDTFDYFYSIGRISQKEYYDALVKLRKDYYGGSTSAAETHSAFEKQLNISIHNLNQSMTKSTVKANTKTLTEGEAARLKIVKESFEQQKKLAKDTYDQNKKLLKDTYDAEKKELAENNKLRRDALEKRYKEEVDAIEDAYKAKEKLINDQIKAIDAEIAARRRLKEETQQENEINAIKAQLAYSKLDEFSRLEDEKAEYQWQKEQENRKNALSQELEDAKLKADQERQAAAEMYAQRKEAIQAEYDAANARLEESYAISIDRLEAQYKLHTDQLESMFASSSAQMGKISSDFVSTITKGCREAASILAGMTEQLSNATRAANQAQNVVTNNTTTNRTANLHVAQGYSADQVRRMVDRILY